MEDLQGVGGLPAVLQMLLEAGLLHVIASPSPEKPCVRM